MDSSFEIVFAAVRYPQGIQPCEESIRSPEIVPPEVDDFRCFEILFTHEHIMATVQNACKALGIRNRDYPARYNRPKFSIPGPYLTWPLWEDRMFTYCKY